ncbi:MAG: family hydrolase [Frankiales bacterium]|nr:family hydrolase [Frankiales bacterium]
MIGSEESLCERYDVALLDLDGVVYVGAQVVDGASEALARARQLGMRLAFVTNNASRTAEQVAELLTTMGVPAEPSDITTSSHAAAHYLADQLPSGSAVLVLGTTGLIDAVTERGLRPVFSADDDPRAVVQGYSPDLGWRQLAEGCVAIRRGTPWVATNLDPTIPSARGPLPGNGALIAALRHATGVVPTATGKPDPTMHKESVLRSGAKRPVVVGDRLDTDIEGARRVGCDSLLVFSGVTTVEELLHAIPLHRPDYIGHDVAALLEPHPAVTWQGAAARCGNWAAVAVDDRIELTYADSGQTSPTTSTPELDPVRALAECAWRAMDSARKFESIMAGDDTARVRLAELQLAPARS